MGFAKQTVHVQYTFAVFIDKKMSSSEVHHLGLVYIACPTLLLLAQCMYLYNISHFSPIVT